MTKNMTILSVLNSPFLIAKRLSLKLRIFFKLVLIVLFLTFIFLIIFYLFQVNAEISEKYLIREKTKTLNKILEENKKLEVLALQLNSLDNLSELVKNINFVKADKVSYIQVLDGQIVSR